MDNSKKSRLFFHSLQYLSNPWISDTPLLCIMDSFHGTNCTRTVLTTSAFNPNILDRDPELSLVPRSPLFLFFSLHYIERKTKQKQRTTWNEATKLKCSNSGRYFNWLTASMWPCSHSQAPTPTFCYLQYTSLYCTLRWHKAFGSVLNVRGTYNQYQYLLLWEHSVLFLQLQRSGVRAKDLYRILCG